MGQGGFIELVNSTPYVWRKTSKTSSHMEKWGFPETFTPGFSSHTYVEWKIHCPKSEECGNVIYTLEGCPDSFIKIRADNHKGYALYVEVSIPETSKQLGTKRTVNLGWRHDGNVNFVLSGNGSRGYTMSGDDMSGWLADALPEFAERKLRELCIVGSHDAGMYKRTHHTLGAEDWNTLTQSVSLYDQLCLGVQYFDIRPVLLKDTFYTGHYGESGGIVAGSTGMSMDEIVSDINRYTQQYNGLVIVNLSHSMRFDSMGKSRDLSDEEWDQLFNVLKGLKARLCRPQETDFTQCTLGDLIGHGPAVLIICEEKNEISEPYRNEGFYTDKSFNVFNSYSNTNKLKEMIDDQLRKMEQYAPKYYFLLSWTLTESVADAINITTSIRKMAEEANQYLEENVYKAAKGTAYPNILYTDNIKNANAAALACALNWKRHSLRRTD